MYTFSRKLAIVRPLRLHLCVLKPVTPGLKLKLAMRRIIQSVLRHGLRAGYFSIKFHVERWHVSFKTGWSCLAHYLFTHCSARANPV